MLRLTARNTNEHTLLKGEGPIGNKLDACDVNSEIDLELVIIVCFTQPRPYNRPL